MSPKLKYKLLAIITPGCWSRNGKTNWMWDTFLWNALIDGKIECVGSHEALIDNIIVWTNNYPYASGTTGKMDSEYYCSRATALFLQAQLKETRILQALRGPVDNYKFWIGESKIFIG